MSVCCYLSLMYKVLVRSRSRHSLVLIMSRLVRSWLQHYFLSPFSVNQRKRRFQCRTIQFLKNNERSVWCNHNAKFRTCDTTLMQNCFIFCQLLTVQRHSRQRQGAAFVLVLWWKCICLLFSWWLKLKKKQEWLEKNKQGLVCFEVNTIAMLLFFIFFQSESKNVVCALLSSVCSAVKKTRAEREASDFLCCTGNSQESHACSAAQQHAGRCAVGRFVFSWAVLVGLWKTLSVLSKLCRAVRTRVELEHSAPFQVLADVGTSIRKLSPNALPVFPVAAVAGTGARMVWDGLGLFDSTALQSHKSFFCFCYVLLFPSSNVVEKVRCSHAFLKTAALKNMNLEPSLLLPLLHTTRWHFRNPLPA